MLRALAGLTLLLSASDHWTTYVCLRAPVEGLSEANPLAAWLFQRVGLVEGLALDSAVTILGLLFLLQTRLLPRGIKVAFLILVALGTGYAVVNNLGVMARIGLSPTGTAL